VRFCGSGYTSEYQALSRATRGTPSWLDTIRQCAFQRFQALGFPTRKNEDWHFTSVAPIAEAAYPPRTARGGDVKPADLASFTFGATDWPTIVFVNGVFAPDLSSLDNLPEGVKVYDMASAFRTGDPVVERNLSKFAPYELNTFTALNSAFVSDGAVVRIAKEFEVDRPIHVLFVSDAMAADEPNPRTLTTAERLEGNGDRDCARRARRAISRTVTEVLLDTVQPVLKISAVPRAFHVGRSSGAGDSHYHCSRSRAVLSYELHDARWRKGGLRQRLYISTASNTDHLVDRARAAQLLQPGAVQGRARWPVTRRVQRKGVRRPDRAEDGRQADEQHVALVGQGADRHEAAARDLRRRCEVHAWRDGGPSR
jgi:hypothetical protein